MSFLSLVEKIVIVAIGIVTAAGVAVGSGIHAAFAVIVEVSDE